jgi:phosphoribosyl-ATP pyrophosphohydrolase/phosphoribosyl-AMP cyclohydrolase
MLKLDANGLVPAVIQDARTGEVLMLGYMNKESLRRTVESGDVWFYSRSRQELWHKGETSGNFLRVVSIAKDCDNDTILVQADPVGPVCHLDTRTCFITEQGEMRGLDADDTV